MNSHHRYFAKPLVSYTTGETETELQDRVRRVVPASGVAFRSGRMFLTGKAASRLATAILDGRIAGDTDQARVIIDQIAKGAMKSGTYLSIGAARYTRKGIVEEGGGDLSWAREHLVFLNRKYPKS